MRNYLNVAKWQSGEVAKAPANDGFAGAKCRVYAL